MPIFIYSEMGLLNEDWTCQDGGSGPQGLLVYGFTSAFNNTYGTQNLTVDYDCSYEFPVPWQNMQAQPANKTFTGPGQYTLNETVTFTIAVQHTPQSP